MIKRVITRFKAAFPLNSLQVQLLSRSLLILAVLLVLIGSLQYIFMRDVIYRNRASSLQSQVMSMPPNVWQQLSIGLGSKDNNRPPRFFLPEANLAFIDSKGNFTALMNSPDSISATKLETSKYLQVIQEYSQQETQGHADGMRKKPKLNYEIIGSGPEQQLVVLQPIGSDPGQMLGVIQVSTMTAPLKELLIGQLLTFLFLSLIALLFGVLGFLPVIKKTLVPLVNMVETAEQIDAGNLARRFPTSQGQQEIDRLAVSFNGMLERLETSFAAELETKEQMRHFIADASHELRTPLTSIHGFLEVLLRGAVEQPDQLRKALKSMHSESERLTKLVHDLLLLAKLDRTPHIELIEDMLDNVIREMEPQLRILAGSRKLSFQIQPNMKCKFDPDTMKQLILNLFQNAVQHTDPEKGHIQVSLAEKDKGVGLSIQDNGIGIAEVHLAHIFDRFYRSDTSRARKYGGAGLGLAITKSIVEAHHGTIGVSSQEGEGCTFLVWIPA